MTFNSSTYDDKSRDGHHARQKASGDSVQNERADHRVRASQIDIVSISRYPRDDEPKWDGD